MRTNMPAFGKRTPLNKEHFKPFELAYGDDSNGKSVRVDEGESGLRAPVYARLKYLNVERI